jgi:hypothetical protein
MSISPLDNLCGTSAINWVPGKVDTQLCHSYIQTDKRHLFQLLYLSVKSDAVRTHNTPAAILAPSARFKRLNDKWENVRILMLNAVCLRQYRLTVCLMLVLVRTIFRGVQCDSISTKMTLHNAQQNVFDVQMFCKREGSCQYTERTRA